MLKRKIEQKLIDWKNTENRKPLIIKGCRQCGKTFSVLDFAKKNYKNVVYLNFFENPDYASVFAGSLEVDTIVMMLSALLGSEAVFESGSTVLILDEIQECPEARTALKFFRIDGRYDVIGTGSLLGVKGYGKEPKSVPVGSETVIDMYPLDFEEFLWANAEFALTREIRNHFSDFSPMGKKLHEKALSQFRLYLIIGGMPAAIMEYKKEKKLLLVPDTQQKLLNLFLSDITALAPKGTARHCRNAWLSIPAQLGRTSRKFQYTRIAKGATAKVYHEPLQWLISAGLAIPCQTAVCSRPSETSLHLYPVDTGLCSCILKIPAFQLLSGEETTAGTACIETFLAQHFIRNGYTLSYWSSGNQAEVPFLLSKNSHFIAIDYRTTPHQKCRNLMQLNKSSLSPAPTQMYLISAEDFRQKEAYRIVPLYAVFCI